MGPALGGSERILSFLGVNGGAGCSTLSCLTARLLAKTHSKKIALIEAVPASYSLTSRALGLDAPSHGLDQCRPYERNLAFRMIENFFPASPEGVFYVPLRQNDEMDASSEWVFPLVQKLDAWFDLILLDLSSFPSDEIHFWLEKSWRTVLLSRTDPSSLSAVHQWEKRLLALHLPSERFKLAFNQQNTSHPLPKDGSAWSPHFQLLGGIPFLGSDLSLQLMETRSIPSTVEKNMAPFTEKVSRFLNSGLEGLPKGVLPRMDITPEPFTLEQVHQLHQRLLEALRQSGTLQDQAGILAQRRTLEPKARELLARLIPEMKPQNQEVSRKLEAETLNLAFGLGPLENLLQDDEITEIMVNGIDQVYAEKNGLLEKKAVRFFDEAQLRTIIERILAPLGRRIDESQPYVDGRLQDGSRINAVIPPLSLTGPLLTIRKFSKKKLRTDDLIRFGSITPEAADFLGACVKARKNILVSGGTGSGKTTLLNILSHFIPPGERIITIEDSAELQLSQDHVLRLEGKPANLEGKGQVSIRDLVGNALRMRPDRIIVGEVRGGEALDMLQAMNTGHDGSLTTAHANSPRDALSRLETMVLFTGLDLPLRAIREQISRAVHLVVQISRLPGGKRSLTQISEIQGMEGEVILLHDLFAYSEDKGLARRPFAPSFIQELNAIGYQWPGHGEKN